MGLSFGACRGTGVQIGTSFEAFSLATRVQLRQEFEPLGLHETGEICDITLLTMRHLCPSTGRPGWLMGAATLTVSPLSDVIVVQITPHQTEPLSRCTVVGRRIVGLAGFVALGYVGRQTPTLRLCMHAWDHSGREVGSTCRPWSREKLAVLAK